ncbi:MAG: GNAT family N-acetyltransferase [Chloroflexi bacterium]|nr:GNAT family N-acetyltransferase [Chloroflexota bacterium]
MKEGSVNGAKIPDPVASGRWVGLRPFSEPDYASFYKWRNDLSEYGIWKGRRIVTAAEFAQELRAIIEGSLLLTVLNQRTLEPIGFAQVYDHSHEDGWAFFTIYLAEGYRSKGHGAEAGLILLDYLFSYYPLRKIYGDALEFNQPSLDTMISAGFEIEGRRKEHAFLHGRYWDLIHLTLTRENWTKLRQRNLTRFLSIPEFS